TSANWLSMSRHPVATTKFLTTSVGTDFCHAPSFVRCTVRPVLVTAVRHLSGEHAKPVPRPSFKRRIAILDRFLLQGPGDGDLSPAILCPPPLKSASHKWVTQLKLAQPANQIVDESVPVGFEFERVAGSGIIDQRKVRCGELAHIARCRDVVDDVV